MAVSIHVPKHLIARVDERAAELKISRSRCITQILDQALNRETDWSERFLRVAQEAREDKDTHRAVDEMEEAIARSRSSKVPPQLLES